MASSPIHWLEFLLRYVGKSRDEEASLDWHRLDLLDLNEQEQIAIKRGQTMTQDSSLFQAFHNNDSVHLNLPLTARNSRLKMTSRLILLLAP
jgi:hypothetical protein